jgi:FkbM family methyltransferase
MRLSLVPGAQIKLKFADRLGYQIYVENFEEWERDFVFRFLRPGDVFLDAGANLGLFSLIAASRVGPVGQVHAVEPARTAFKMLVENVSLNRFENVKCHNLAFSDRDEERPLHVCGDGFFAWSSFGKPVGDAAYVEQTDELIKCVALDGFVDSNRISCIDLMKVDVEGWEHRLFSGGRKVLSRSDAPVLMVEFSDATAANCNSSCALLRTTLESLGFRLYRYNAKERSLYAEPPNQAYPYDNLIAVKNLSAVYERLHGTAPFSVPSKVIPA